MKKSHPLLVGIENVKPYKLTEGHEMYSVRPPAMQIEDFLPVGGVMGMTSYPGVGKTWLALEIARSVASGTPFLGRYKAMRGGVLFVGSDSSLYDYARQWTRLTRNTEDAVNVFEPVRFLVQSTFMFEDRDEIRKLIRTHQKFEWGETTIGPKGPEREHGFHTLVFDTVSRLTRANQNDNTEMEEVFRNIRMLAEATDCAIVLLHHNSKKSEYNDGSDWRGAMSQIGALDSWVQLSPHRKDKHLVGIQFKKFRGITPPDFSYRMAVSDPASASLSITDEPVTTAQKMQHDVVADAVKEFIVQHPGRRACEIRDALWPKFQVGVAEVNGTTTAFPVIKDFTTAVNNRLAAMMQVQVIKRRQNNEGKAVYTVVTPQSTEGAPAPATGEQSEVRTSRRRRRKAASPASA